MTTGEIVRARKPYGCEWCHGDIVVGERHFHFAGTWQRAKQDWRMHVECEDAHQEETSEGEICEEHHPRGMTCYDRDKEEVQFEKELAETLKDDLTRHPNDFRNAAETARQICEERAEAELERIDKLREAAMTKSTKVG